MDPNVPQPEQNSERIIPVNVADEVSKSFLDYSMSVIISRALPDARDGLKPSQRRILYAMKELNLMPGRQHIKCAKICGDTSGNYHPHGEAVIYPTLVNMAQSWSMRDTLVDGQGNFGSVEGDPPAAMRYTEARLTHLGAVLMSDMDKDTVDFIPNYDERLTEPVVLPAAFPNLLVNGGTGIAVGMATNLAPHNLGEVIDGISAQIDNPDISVNELMGFIKGPDFPTGCVIHGYKGIHDYAHTGRGSVRVRGRITVEENGSRESLIITEIPYNVNRATLVQKIAQLVNEKIIPEISALRDESDENTRVVIELKKDARAQVVISNLYNLTALESTFSVNMLAIHNRRPKLLNLKEAVQCYIDHRREVIIRRTRFLLNKAEERAEILEAYLLAISAMDDFIRLIRESANRDEARAKLQAYSFLESTARGLGILIRENATIIDGRYHFSARQVDAILELRLYQLTALEQDKTKNEYDSILATIKDLMDILAREVRVMNIIKDELREVRARHATPRKTEIVADAGEIVMTDLIANTSNIITITHRGYIKRTASIEFRAQKRGGKGLKGMEARESQDENEPNDFVEHLFAASAHDWLLFFTNKGRLFVDRVYQIPELPRTSKGRSIRNVLDMPADEKIAAVQRLEATSVDDEVGPWAEDRFVFFATRNGVVKKTRLSEFRNVRKAGIRALNIEDGDELIGVRLTKEGDEILLVTYDGYCLRCMEDQIRPMGRTATGVIGIRLRDDSDRVVSLGVCEPNAELLVVSENGLGKRTPWDLYRQTNRGGKGVITLNVTDKTGSVIGGVLVHAEDEVMLMTNKGQSVRIRVSEIRQTNRNAQGVKLMNLKEGEKIQDIARVVPDGDDESSDSESSDVLELDAPLDEGSEEE